MPEMGSDQPDREHKEGDAREKSESVNSEIVAAADRVDEVNTRNEDAQQTNTTQNHGGEINGDKPKVGLSPTIINFIRSQARQTYWPAVGAVADVVSAVVIAIFTGILVFYGNRQLGIMGKQLGQIEQQLSQADSALKQTDASLDLMRRDQRPWLGIERIDIIDAKKGTCDLVVRNAGNSPAFVDSHCGFFFVFRAKGTTREKEEKFLKLMEVMADANARNAPDTPDYQGPVLPDNEVVLARIQPAAIPKEVKDRLAEVGILGSKEFRYLVGVVFYHDTFNLKRKTAYCYFLAPGGDKFIANKKGNYME